MQYIIRSIAIFFLLTTAFTSHSQDIPIPDYTIYNQARIGTLITQGVIDDYQKKGTKHKAYVVGRPGTSKPTLVYAATPSLKQQTVINYSDRLKATNPAAANLVLDKFGPGKYDYGIIYNGLVKGKGLQEIDAVDVVASYMVLGYMIVNNVQDGNAVTPAMVQAARSQFGPSLANNPKLAAQGVPAQVGEELKLQFVVVQGGWQSAIKENNLAAYQQGVSSLFKTQWNLDFSKLKLTNKGFTAQ